MTTLQELAPSWKSISILVLIVLASAAGGYAIANLSQGNSNSDEMMADTGCEDVLYWYDPMVPDQRFDEPGKSPFMDMQLVAKCGADNGGMSAGVSIDPALAQSFGIRTAKAEMGALAPNITASGILAYNGSDVALVQPRANGFVQRTYGLAPQDVVARGTPIVDLLVPEWEGAQREYLAVAASGDVALTSAALERMRLLGMPASLVSTVERTGRLHSTVTITAPHAGTVTMLGVRPGMSVMAGQTLAEISGYSPIWLEAAVPESQAADLALGQPLTATFSAFPSENYSGHIIAILPSLSETSRTITVRAVIPNHDLRLKPGMFAEVRLASEPRDALLVPSEAVIRTGERTLVMIAMEESRYRPAEVRIGRETGGQTEILAGLVSGEEVVTSGQFLIDSEASLSGIDVRPIDEASDMGSNQ